MKLKAFTLFESTVAVTLITIVLGMSTLIYSNILDSERPVAFYQARQKVDQIFFETKISGSFFSKNFSFEAYDVEQKVDFYKGNKRLYQVDYKVVSAGKELWKESHLVANTQYEEKGN
ncbi:MAG: hypothetical protein HUJ25_17890 [Crocinitomicaceae bacterium]|nr:hypothetical protein [Crocinitomicaceae bacterium]